jgi:BirA family transcriptional regulator, biotin operon repressor / biotin---[acetyl-CoA-carboxylase] ligase
MDRFLARSQRFAVVGSTNDVVRDWLADGTPEVCLAIADEQTAGRGRHGRAWVAPRGAAVLLSLGFRPTRLDPARVWQLAAVTSLAMAEAAEDLAGLSHGEIRLKWPNDLVVERAGGIRKLAGVLGETDGLGSKDPRVIVGIGMNVDWPASSFPPELAESMTSLREVAFGRPVDRIALSAAFVDRLRAGVQGLRGGRFHAADWADRQVTTGAEIDLTLTEGATETVRASGVDASSGALLVEDPTAPGGRRAVVVGEVRQVRLAGRGAPRRTGRCIGVRGARRGPGVTRWPVAH